MAATKGKKKGKGTKSSTFTAEEKAAMKERAAEAKGKGTGEAAVIEKISQLPKGDRAMAKKVHDLVMKTAPDLEPRTWYGMPAYSKDGKVVCFFQGAEKFKARYATIGFNDAAKLDQGSMWPTSFALLKLTSAEEKKIASLVKKAVR